MVGRPFLGKSLRLRGRFVAGLKRRLSEQGVGSGSWNASGSSY